MKKRIQELENALADVLAVIPQFETFYGAGENYLETVTEARKILRKFKPRYDMQLIKMKRTDGQYTIYQRLMPARHS